MPILTPLNRMPWGFELLQNDRNYAGTFLFNAAVYDPAAVRAMTEGWNRLTVVLAKDPDQSLGRALAAAQVASSGSLRIGRIAQWLGR